MKKTFVILMLCTLLILAACGEGKPEQTVPQTTTPAGPNMDAPVEPGFVFSYKDTGITMKADAQHILAALGEPMSYTETASCAFTGLDKTYYYGSFYLYTCPIEGKDYI